ncbi:hypothetical protein A1Z85_RS11235 [Acinetobacter baumannii]|uniref:hypothetical protein n=1 Tax=Acinetobacter baumannii TaxID=470 RepID=UPI00028C960A|nr:hypothetical protein [Acinetobacter baumannii]EHU1441371.1 hypothetical protein [Acinetobacter baumannii]EHU1809191.1 hypothetical protein [Acinetobacter baumannii]EHU2698579.1 hypothetical protein [Acinetobacter baumannii]EKL57122.1 GIY-YIG catalytic domain protein [Acinetobacter baumannii OIFC110]MCF4555246.1 hypothetical protein [Acinetobacter baumannii]
MKKFNYLDQLIANCEEAKKAFPIREITLENIADIDKIKDFKSAIYIIREIGGCPLKTFNDFTSFKEEEGLKGEKGMRCAQPNGPSEILYIGSSTTGVRRRLREHTTKLGSLKTSALRLNNWFKGQYQIHIKEYDVSRDVLQLIEDNLAFELKPAFGKRGPNGK